MFYNMPDLLKVMGVKERLQAFIDTKHLSNSDFERECSLGGGVISKIKDRIGKNSLKKILIIYPELNESWLLRDEGEMIIKNQKGYSAHDNELISEDGSIKFFNCTECISKQKRIEELEELVADLRNSVRSHLRNIEDADLKIQMLSNDCQRKKAGGL